MIKIIEQEGSFLDRTRGSHRQFKHSSKAGIVTIAGELGADIARDTEDSLLKQAGL
jgi:predicted RNA binding protein YcfA (HicA-like mRNA interferase family)